MLSCDIVQACGSGNLERPVAGHKYPLERAGNIAQFLYLTIIINRDIQLISCHSGPETEVVITDGRGVYQSL